MIRESSFEHKNTGVIVQVRKLACSLIVSSNQPKGSDRFNSILSEMVKISQVFEDNLLVSKHF